MISKNKIKFIRSLERKKARKEQGVFVVEGPKNVADMMPAFKCVYVAATKKWLCSNENVLKGVEHDEISQEELRKVSFQEHPQQVIAVFSLPDYVLDLSSAKKQIILALDDIQNPGNLGTIIRIADWFGINDIICSQATADAFSPKTVQAAMGSIARVRIHYADLKEILKDIQPDIPVYGTFLDGDDIYQKQLGTSGIIVMGNEGNGISDEIRQLVTEKLTISHYNKTGEHPDSLNVAIATAIVCAEFRRKGN